MTCYLFICVKQGMGKLLLNFISILLLLIQLTYFLFYFFRCIPQVMKPILFSVTIFLIVVMGHIITLLEVLNLSTNNILSQIILCCRVCPVHYKIFNSVSGLYLDFPEGSVLKNPPALQEP